MKSSQGAAVEREAELARECTQAQGEVSAGKAKIEELEKLGTVHTEEKQKLEANAEKAREAITQLQDELESLRNSSARDLAQERNRADDSEQRHASKAEEAQRLQAEVTKVTQEKKAADAEVVRLQEELDQVKEESASIDAERARYKD